jgi:hypothetical protein
MLPNVADPGEVVLEPVEGASYQALDVGGNGGEDRAPVCPGVNRGTAIQAPSRAGPGVLGGLSVRRRLRVEGRATSLRNGGPGASETVP